MAHGKNDGAPSPAFTGVGPLHSRGSLYVHGCEPILSLLLFTSARAFHSSQPDLKLHRDFLWSVQAEEEPGGMEKHEIWKILFNLLPALVAQHFLLSNPRNMDLYYQF